MQRIALMTDSSCDLDKQFLDAFDIRVLPLAVIYRERQYRDGVDIQPEEVYARLSEEVPRTAMPSPGDAKEILEGLAGQGYTHILAIHISSGLSGTFEMVRTVSKEIQGLTVEVIDSKTLSMGLGFIVRKAASWIREGVDFYELVERLRILIPRVKGYFVLRSLEYLKRGGRIGLVSAAIGEILDLKPIISINESGTYYPLAKVRGRTQSLERLYQIAQEALAKRRSVVAVLQGDASQEAMNLLERIKLLPNLAELMFRPISPALVVHTGPGLVGLIIAPAE